MHRTEEKGADRRAATEKGEKRQRDGLAKGVYGSNHPAIHPSVAAPGIRDAVPASLVTKRERVPLQRLGNVRSDGVSRLRRQRLVVARHGHGFRPRDRGEQLRDRLAVVTPAVFSFFEGGETHHGSALVKGSSF